MSEWEGGQCWLTAPNSLALNSGHGNLLHNLREAGIKSGRIPGAGLKQNSRGTSSRELFRSDNISTR